LLKTSIYIADGNGGNFDYNRAFCEKKQQNNTVSNVVTVALSPFQEFINYLGDRVEGAAKYFQDIEALSQEMKR